jgi:predicted nucleic acid-binding protein
MEILVDASALLAVVLNESERDWIMGISAGATLTSPAVLHYEVGSALVAMYKRKKLSQQEVLDAQMIAQSVPVRLVAVDVHGAIEVAMRLGSYAYDAYYLQSSLDLKLPLLTLDEKMRADARTLGIAVLE